MLSKLAKDMVASPGLIRGERRINTSFNKRDGQAFTVVTDPETGRVGHMYNADDPSSIIWLARKKTTSQKIGPRAQAPRIDGSVLAALAKDYKPNWRQG